MPNLVSIRRVQSVLTAAFVIFTGGLLLASISSSLLAQDSQTADEVQENQVAFLPYVERILPFDQWPECPPEQHDANQWHSLVDRDSQCHYDHEHKDDPHLLDDVFGTQVYEWAGGSISYPWQTGDGHGENEHKHETYGWFTLRDLPPEASESEDGIVSGADTGFIKHLRIQGHFDLHAMGAPTRFHSTYIEVMICYKDRPNDCGIARFGGHLDYGELRVDGNWVPLPNDPDEYDGIDPPAVPERDYDNVIDKRGHTTWNNRVGWIGRFHGSGDNVIPIGYSGFNHRTMDAFGPLDPNNVGAVSLTDIEVYNNSTHGLDFFIMRMRHWMADENGRINWFGYATRYGLDGNPNCAEPGLDCVPVSFENVPSMRGIFIQPREIKEYDVSPPGVSWIEYPN